MTRDGLRILLGTSALLWLGLLLAPVVLAEESWLAVQQHELDYLFVDRTAPPPSLNAVHIEPVSVWYPSSDAAAAERADTLRQCADEIFAATLDAAGMVIVDDRSAATTTVNIQLIDLKTATTESEWLDLARNFRFRMAAGRLTLVAEIRDRTTGRTLARIADLEDAEAGFEAPTAAVERVLAAWGVAVAASMDRNSEQGRFASLGN